MITKIEYNAPPSRRAYAMILMLIGSTVISFGGLVIRNIETADNWQINWNWSNIYNKYTQDFNFNYYSG